MWFIVSKKKHQRAVDLHKSNVEWWANRANDLQDLIKRQDDVITEQNKKLASSERKKVLSELQEALHLIQTYQRALASLSAADPNILQANNLLEKWNLKGEASATYLGLPQDSPALGLILKPGHIETSYSGDWKEKMNVPDPLPPKRFSPPSPQAINRWKLEEEEWGDQAYGSGNVRIEAEAIDEGNDKEPGITRAHIRYTDLDASESPALAAAKAVTEEADSLEPGILT